MCLSNASPLREAREDLTVYKVVFSREKNPEEMYTPFWEFSVQFGKKYESFLSDPTEGPISEWGKVHIGIHSFIKKEDAEYLAENLQRREGMLDYHTDGLKETFFIVKCIIPKGTGYYEGNFQWGGVYLKSITSSKIKYVEKV